MLRRRASPRRSRRTDRRLARTPEPPALRTAQASGACRAFRARDPTRFVDRRFAGCLERVLPGLAVQQDRGLQVLRRDALGHESRDVVDLLRGQRPLESGHPAAAVPHLRDDTLEVRHAGQRWPAVSAQAVDAVAARTVLREDLFARGRVTLTLIGRLLWRLPAWPSPSPAPPASAGPIVPSSENSQSLSPCGVAARALPPARKAT